jgi:AbiTii-like protein
VPRKTSVDLVAEIEKEAVDGGGSVAAALRKCLVLGGELRSPELREWASRELNGYEDEDEVPAYRIVPATLKIDGSDMVKIVTGQTISPAHLPDFARDQVREELRFVSGIGKIE